MITLKTLAEASAQQVFDQVATHLLTQQNQSISVYGICLYRGPEDLRCAAGCLVADDEYSDSMENAGWLSLVKYKKVPGTHAELIQELQEVHDFHTPSEWRTALHELANEHELEFNH
jgi:hypothetical protein